MNLVLKVIPVLKVIEGFLGLKVIPVLKVTEVHKDLLDLLQQSQDLKGFRDQKETLVIEDREDLKENKDPLDLLEVEAEERQQLEHLLI